MIAARALRHGPDMFKSSNDAPKEHPAALSTQYWLLGTHAVSPPRARQFRRSAFPCSTIFSPRCPALTPPPFIATMPKGNTSG